MSVRVRFAPSPTGLLHVGALRTALYDWLLAKQHGGANILRIEDTDRSRYDANSEQEFIDTLAWVGITFDEGPHVGGPNAPYRQSERKSAGVYAPHVQTLLDKGAAYKAFDTSEELERMRETQTANKEPQGYFGGAWRDATSEQVNQAEADGKPYVIRLKIPRDTTISLEDAIRGTISVDSNTVDDPVMIKADGMPTYHFAAMVDDHLMGITHVLRGVEWINSAPKHACLFDAFGWEKPIFVHCPVIVGTDGKKLSKRHGATRVLDYAAQGFMPDPLKNFIALIGWSPGEDREILSPEELIESFTIDRIQPSSGMFDLNKLKSINAHAIRAMSPKSLLETVIQFIDFPYTETFWTSETASDDPDEPARDLTVWPALRRMREAFEADPAYALEAVELVQERVVTLADFGHASEFLFVDSPAMEPAAVAKWFGESHVSKLLATFRDLSTGATNPTAEECEKWIRDYAAAEGFEKLGPVVHPIRIALTGKTNGPGLFELMAVLGSDRMAARFERALGMLVTV